MSDAREKAVERLASVLVALHWSARAIKSIEHQTGLCFQDALEETVARGAVTYPTAVRAAERLLDGLVAIDSALVEAVEATRKGSPVQDSRRNVLGHAKRAPDQDAAHTAAKVDLADAVLAQLR
jgi:hypothetical protein